MKKKKVIVICSHLLRDRSYRKDPDPLQPMAGLHIASCIDREKYAVTLYHEISHGPYDTANIKNYDLVFLSGIQKDFDRMRQLSYYFKQTGAIIAAGGSICTLFPEFAANFFDIVCSGGVDGVSEILKDYENNSLKQIYYSPQHEISDYTLDHSILNKNGINIPAHLIEASRGCNYSCGFCTIPAEKARHTPYKIETIIDAVKDSVKYTPFFSLKKIYPAIYFIDNHFTVDRVHTETICTYLKNEKKIKGWGALVSQDILSDRELIRLLKSSKCETLFIGLESIDINFLIKNNKKQNLKNVSQIIDDILYAQEQGIIINYGYLFDPRISPVTDMKNQIKTLLNTQLLTFPSFFSFVSPLLGTKIFWESVRKKELLPNLRLRDLDGCTLAYNNHNDNKESTSAFAELIFAKPNVFIKRRFMLIKTIKYIINFKIKHPIKWYVVFLTNFRAYRLFRTGRKAPARNYIGGDDILDPQYNLYPATISREDLERYFKPIQVTNEKGDLASWLEYYSPYATSTTSRVTSSLRELEPANSIKS
ncbi:MAG: hypothetical protein GY754_45130 [bacterium]|nr:hypothetical protein [bacterium]